MAVSGLVEHALARRVDLWRLPSVHRRRGHVTNPGMVMLRVVPAEKGLGEIVPVLDRLETVGEVRLVLQPAKLHLGERIVVADTRPAVALGDAQLGEPQGEGLRAHRAAAISVPRELFGADLFTVTGRGNLAGPLSLVMPQDHSWHGARASSSGLV